ncbi:uncharacterized protein LOC144643969 [Oculina patagonica]
MTENISGIPVVDFSAMSLEHNNPLSKNADDVKKLADQVYQAFSTIGFVYLKNHGIPQEIIDSTFETFDKFFNLSLDVKQKYSKETGTTKTGWDELERESTNIQRPGDLKESFDVSILDDDDDFEWPNAEVPNFQDTVKTVFKYITDLGSRMLSVMAISLNMEPDTFEYAFEKSGSSVGGASLRYNYYPMIPDISKVKPGQIRCGEHTDYAGITLLIQDDVGGLEVANVNGQFVPATPMKGTVLVNIADFMQRWTADRFKSTVHRVLIPEAEIKRRVPRRSLVLFYAPDDDTMVTCLDGSNKYPPIRARDWIYQQLHSTYKF